MAEQNHTRRCFVQEIPNSFVGGGGGVVVVVVVPFVAEDASNRRRPRNRRVVAAFVREVVDRNSTDTDYSDRCMRRTDSSIRAPRFA